MTLNDDKIKYAPWQYHRKNYIFFGESSRVKKICHYYFDEIKGKATDYNGSLLLMG